MLWSDIYGLTFQMSGPNSQGCNVLIADGVDDLKVVALFVISGHSKCHDSNAFG